MIKKSVFLVLLEVEKEIVEHVKKFNFTGKNS